MCVTTAHHSVPCFVLLLDIRNSRVVSWCRRVPTDDDSSDDGITSSYYLSRFSSLESRAHPNKGNCLSYRSAQPAEVHTMLHACSAI
eukprot:scaffold32566_cov56-Attheya_sp.AAC.2